MGSSPPSIRSELWLASGEWHIDAHLDVKSLEGNRAKRLIFDFPLDERSRPSAGGMELLIMLFLYLTL